MENSFNQCNLPPWVIASRHFNDNPQPLHIQGVRLANRFLFDRLDSIASAEERAEIFDGYMSVKFQLHQWQDQTPTARKSLKNSYLRFLRGWMMDSNSVEGAVLKGWVESRIGLPPTFHHERIPDSHSEQYMKYAVDRTKGSARTSAINSQLDLLYEYCQYELQKRYPDRKTLTLYRGTFERSEHDVLEVVSKREEFVRLNNLNSFTTDEERAWEFGFIVWEVEVPLEKIFFFSELLPTSILKGEGECLVIGGDYRVRKIACTIST